MLNLLLYKMQLVISFYLNFEIIISIKMSNFAKNKNMTNKELQKYLIKRFSVENEQWEWKEFSHLKHAVKGQEGEDFVSYISAISNMKGGSHFF